MVLLLGLVVVIIGKNYFKQAESWSEIKHPLEYQHIVHRALLEYKQSRINYRTRQQNYDVFGDYLNYGISKNYKETKRMIFDEEAIPKVKYGEEFYYNPVTVSQYALSKYGQYLRMGDELSKEKFLIAVNKLLDMQDGSGAFRYFFPWKYYLTGETFAPGWVSGMAQGQVLSVLSRAYFLTKDQKYLIAGNKAIEFLITPVEKGGTMSTLEDLDVSLKRYIFFEEYVSSPNNYTLNGFMFTLLGLYDWSVVTKKYQNREKNLASSYFDSGINTLIHILPYYDIGGFSAYDLGHLTFHKKPHIGVRYHAVHINLLHALHSVTYNNKLKDFETLWSSYIEK